MGRCNPFLRAIIWAASLSLLVTTAAAKPAATRPATQPATTVPAALLPQRWPGAAYDIRRNGHVVSRVTFRTESAGDDAGGPGRLTFADALVLDPAGGGKVIRVTTVCQADDALTPLRVMAEESGPDDG